MGIDNAFVGGAGRESRLVSVSEVSGSKRAQPLGNGYWSEPPFLISSIS
jgi:hypothetical protein